MYTIVAYNVLTFSAYMLKYKLESAGVPCEFRCESETLVLRLLNADGRLYLNMILHHLNIPYNDNTYQITPKKG